MSATEMNETLLRMASVPLYPCSLPGRTAVGQSTEGIGHWVQAPVVGRLSFLTPIPQLVQTDRGRDPRRFGQNRLHLHGPQTNQIGASYAGGEEGRFGFPPGSAERSHNQECVAH
jgi:hypothetical protein